MFSIWPTQPIWIALTKHNRFEWLIQQTYFSQFWRLGNSRSKCWPVPFLVRTFYLQMVSCRTLPTLSSHSRRRANSRLSSFSCKDTIPTSSPPSQPHLNLLTYQRPPPPILLHWVFGLQYLNVMRTWKFSSQHQGKAGYYGWDKEKMISWKSFQRDKRMKKASILL